MQPQRITSVSGSVSGLVVKSIVAIDGPRVRFAADAFLPVDTKIQTMDGMLCVRLAPALRLPFCISFRHDNTRQVGIASGVEDVSKRGHSLASNRTEIETGDSYASP